jgi:subtilisin family serine protease
MSNAYHRFIPDKLLLFAFFSFFILIFSPTQAQISQGGQTKTIRVKFSPTMASRLDRASITKSASGYAQMGIAAVDQLNTQFKASSMKRVFRPAGKYEAKHRKYGLHLWYEVKVSTAADVQSVVARYSQTAEIQKAEPVLAKRFSDDPSPMAPIRREKKLTGPPNDPRYPEQWHYNNTGQGGGTPGADIKLPQAWAIETGKSTVIVAVTDGGIQVNHPDLAANMWVNTNEIPGNNIDDDNNGYVDDINGYGFGDNSGTIAPDEHGTHVGGTVAAVNNNGVGVAGVAGGSGNGDGVRLMSCAAFGANNTGGFEDTYTYAADNGAVISQNSWGYTDVEVFEQAVLDAIDYFIAEAGKDENGNPTGPMQGGIVIFAAGNSGADGKWYPGYYEPVIAVAGSDRNDKPYTNSNRGTWVELAAPAVGVLSTVNGSSYGTLTGTSMACPHVSGTAALIISKFSGSITPAQVRDRLINTTDKVPTLPATYGNGRLNAFNALQENDNSTPNVITNLTIAEALQTSITLSFTAPADPGNGSASSYDLRYSTSPITAANFASATKVRTSAPLPAGQTQTITVTGLKTGTTYYFAIKSADFFGNLSAISNVVSGKTAPAPRIRVLPTSITATVNAGVSPIVKKTLTVTNLGKGPLEFTARVAAVNTKAISQLLFPGDGLSKLDESLYGKNSQSKEKIAKGKVVTSGKGKQAANVQTLADNFTDSLYYDNNDAVADDFVGFNSGAAFAAATKFNVSSGSFTLTHVRNLYRTAPLTAAPVILEVYRGGTTPANGTLLTSQTINQLSAEGKFFSVELEVPQTFLQNEVFWVVFKYPDGIDFPQGVDSNVTDIDSIYFYSPDGGSTWNDAGADIPGAAFKTRALSGESSTSWVTLNPATDTIAPGASKTVEVAFDGRLQNNGVYKFNVLFTSNDPVYPVVTIPTTVNVIGQKPELTVSTNILEFGSVFIGGTEELPVEVTNTGKANLIIRNYFSSKADFVVLNQPDTLIPGEKTTVKVRFTPQGLGNRNGVITIKSNNPTNDAIKIVVTGTGVEAPVIKVTPDTVFTALSSGATKVETITIQNAGRYPLTFSFPDFAAQSLLNDPSTPKNNTSRVQVTELSSKASADTRAGHAVQLGAGTDKNFGYTWIDSKVAGGPVFSWQDITTTGTVLTPGGDGSVKIDIPFPFDFYGQSKDSIYVASNGFLTFNPSLGLFGGYSNEQIPVASVPNDLIAPFWNDLEPQLAGGSIHYLATSSVLIIQYTNIPSFGTITGKVTFQAKLYRNGDIEFLYKDVATASFLKSATVGIENATGTDGAQVVFNNTYLQDSLAVRFIAPQPDFITGVSKVSGVIAPFAKVTVQVTVSAGSLQEGVYVNNLIISSNDLVTPAKAVPFVLTVTGKPAIEILGTNLAFDTVFVGKNKQLPFSIYNTGTANLTVSNIVSTNPAFTIPSISDTTVYPGGQLQVWVTFTPTTVGIATGEILVNSNDAFGNDSLVVEISGVGVTPPSIVVTPASLAYTVTPGTTIADTLTIANQGGSKLNYTLASSYLVHPAIVATQALSKKNAVALISKDQKDTRVGSPVQYSTGGPDGYGYSWADNKSGTSISYNWIEISATGQKLTVRGDDAVKVALPFSFPFYGNSKDSVYIASNGFLTFNSNLGTVGGFSNQPVPNPVAPNDLIAAFWDDLEPQRTGAAVYYQSAPDAFIVQYTDVPAYGIASTGKVTFQVILYPNGSIKLQYKDVATASFLTSATVGIEDPTGTSGLQVAYNTAYISNGLAVLFSAPVRGSIAPGASDAVDITIATDALTPGIYQDSIVVRSNDPNHLLVSIPVTITVAASAARTGAGAETLGSALSLENFPNPAVHTTSITYVVPQTEHVTLKLFNNGIPVQTLVNEVQAAGKHQVDINVSRLTKGTYLYKIQIGNKVETRKLIVQ